LFLYENRIVSTAYCGIMTKKFFFKSLIISAFHGNTVRLVAQLLSNLWLNTER